MNDGEIKVANNDLKASITINNPVAYEFIESKIEKLKSELSYQRKLNIGMRSFFLILLIIGLLGLADVLNINNIVSSIISIICGLIVAVSFANSKHEQLAAEIRALEQQKNRIENKSANQKTTRYFDDLVSINLRNLEDYYELVKNSNRKSFTASLLMSIFGLLLISSGLIVSYLYDDLEDISYIVTSSGVLVEAISGLMFYLYNKTVLQLKGYHDSLLDVQNILLCFKLVEDTDDDNSRTEVMKQMIEYLMKRKSL
ncbi:hypothetical protein NYE48_05050 [Paenibacillus sp. FSL M7-1455]|uniref:TRADD-N-associated membrane domain-containing protein n=1 Tax=Paenibacillus sp. FSL M7-1455 TaxID=2975316 RepID=UPI0030F90E77